MRPRLLSCVVRRPEELPLTPLVLSLVSAEERMPAGTMPVLRLTIRNAGGADERVTKPRGDLQDTLYDLVITQGGDQVELPRAISDPGPTGDDDMLTLRPGEAVTFEFDWYAEGIHCLPPGEYQASIRFWQGFHKPYTSAVLSPAVTLKVVG
jgi:hypothetical protein